MFYYVIMFLPVRVLQVTFNSKTEKSVYVKDYFIPGVIFLLFLNYSFSTEYKKVHKYLGKIKQVLLFIYIFHHIIIMLVKDKTINKVCTCQRNSHSYFALCPTSVPVGGSKAHILFIKKTLMNNIH